MGWADSVEPLLILKEAAVPFVNIYAITALGTEGDDPA